METSLRLIAATADAQGHLMDALTDHGVACHSQGKMVVVDGAIDRVRDALSGPEREAVSVVEDLEFPGEFPVTTRLEAWWSVFETSWFEKAVATDAFSVWFQPVVDTTARQTIGHECLLRLTRGARRSIPRASAATPATSSPPQPEQQRRKPSAAGLCVSSAACNRWNRAGRKR